MRNRMLGTWAVVVACGLLAFTASAQAASIQSLVDFSGVPGNGTENKFADNSVEFLITNISSGSGTLDVGDIVRGILNIDSVRNVGTGVDQDLSDNNVELSGIFQTEVIKKVATGGTDSNGNPLFDMWFGPSASLSFPEASALGLSASTMVVMWQDKSPDYQQTAGPDTDGTLGSPYVAGGGGSSDEAFATDGTFFWGLGFNGATVSDGMGGITGVTTLSEAWKASGIRDVAGTFGTDPTQIGSAFYSLNRILGANGLADGWKLDGQVGNFGSTKVEVTGDTTFRVSNSQAAWPVNDQANFTIFAVSAVPLPAAAWMGIALLGALGLGRRLRRRS